MKQILLIHPGTTEYDKQGRIQGTLDVPLSEDGRRQVQGMVAELRELNPSGLYAAPGQASQQTSQMLGELLALKPRTLDKLTNVDQGLWQGMLVTDVKTKQPKVFRQWLERPETVCPPQGETIPHARQRVSDVVEKLVKKIKPDSTVLLVAPDPLASVIRHVLSGADLGDLWHTGATAGRWERFEVGKPKEVVESGG
jgi:phosphoserine phosphatase